MCPHFGSFTKYDTELSHLHQAYTSNVQNYLVLWKLLQPFLVQMQVATKAELEQISAQMEEEVHTPWFCAIDYLLTVWGYKQKSR